MYLCCSLFGQPYCSFGHKSAVSSLTNQLIAFPCGVFGSKSKARSETSSSLSRIVGNIALSGIPQRVGWSEGGSEGEGDGGFDALGAILGPSDTEDGTLDEMVGTKETVDVGDRLVVGDV